MRVRDSLLIHAVELPHRSYAVTMQKKLNRAEQTLVGHRFCEREAVDEPSLQHHEYLIARRFFGWLRVDSGLERAAPERRRWHKAQRPAVARCSVLLDRGDVERCL